MSDFISYASEDRTRAQKLAQVLGGEGWSIFWDRTIPIGKTWREVVGKELNQARCVIVLWSKTSIESSWVQEEADDGARRGILVPVLIENVRPPIGFRSIQAADLSDWDATEPTYAFRRLIVDIVGLIGPPPKEAEEEEEAQRKATEEAEARRKAEEERKRAEAEERKRRAGEERKRRAEEERNRVQEEERQPAEAEERKRRALAGKIFINYRRGDDPGITRALYDHLEDEFAAGDLLMDVEGHIKPGDDFVEVLNTQVAAADVVLVVIGPRWADLLAARDGDDFVGIEIKAALDQGKRVIPVLVGDANMPRADALPEAIRSLARRNAVGLRPERFRADCQGLVSALKESLAAAEQERAARTEAERKAAAAARVEAEGQAAARAIAAEERGREKAAAGLSVEDIRKAEELASWDFVKDRNDVQDLRDHLARFPGGATERWARTKLDGLMRAGLGSAPTIEQLRGYLDEFPKGANAGPARARIAGLQKEVAEARADEQRAHETAEWGALAASSDIEAMEQHAEVARARIATLESEAEGARAADQQWAQETAEWTVWQHAEAVRQHAEAVRAGARRAEGGIKVDATIVYGAPEGWFLPGNGKAEWFKDHEKGPEMVVVPAGSFVMGSPESEPQREGTESPQHDVTIARPFAIARHPVTRRQFDWFVNNTGHKRSWGGRVWVWMVQKQDDSHPVLWVSWEDAKAFAAWLSRQSGRDYRLLTEAEWEYATRAGTTTPFWWGSTITPAQANYNGNYVYGGGGGKGECRYQTVAIGEFAANPWGLYQVHGNVWEWCEDVWHENYNGAPSDGSAWLQGGEANCRVVRGGSWNDSPRLLRSAGRDRFTTGIRNIIIGFRVGRTLTP